MTLRRSLTLACLMASMAFTPVAQADDAAMAEAQKRFQEGLPLMDAGKFEEARLKFLQAVAVLKAPPIYYNLASTEQKTGHDVEAVEHFRAFLKTASSDTRITDVQREKARQNIAAILPKLGQLTVDVPGAKLTVDGTPYGGDLKESVPVTPGKHKVEAAVDGRVKSATVHAKAGEVTPVVFDADDPAPTTAQVPTVTPPVATDTPQPTSKRSTLGYAVPIGMGALGLAAVGVGIAFLVDSNVKANAASDFNADTPGGACSGATPVRCQSYDVQSDAASESRTVSTVAFIGGGLLVAGAVTTFLFWPPTKSDRGARVAPMLGSLMGVQGVF